MSDFRNGKIYQIRCKSTGDVYIGSTVKTLKKRLSTHIRAWRSWRKGSRGRVTVYPIIDRGTFVIELIEDYPCYNRVELRERERFHIQGTDCVNKNIPTRTAKEYFKTDKRKKAKRERYQKKKVLYNRKFRCACGIICAWMNKRKHEKTLRHTRLLAEKSNPLLVRDKVEYQREMNRASYLKHKEFRTRKIQCACGLTFTKNNKTNHQKSKKHVQLMTVNLNN